MDISTIMYIIAGIIGAFGLSFAFSKHKTVNGRSRWVFALPLIVVALFIVLMQIGTLATWGLGISPLASGVTTTSSPSGTQASILGCDLGTKTTVTLSGVDKYTNSASGGTHRYRVNGGPATTLSDAGTFTASPYDKISVLWMNASTTSYFSAISDESVACTGAVTFSHPLSNNGSLTSTVFNENTQVNTLGSNNQTLGTSDIKDVTVRLAGSFQADYPYGFLAVVEYNKTALDGVKLTLDGQELTQGTSVPNVYVPLWGTNGATKTYIIPALTSNADFNFKEQLDASNSMNPTSTNQANVTITYYPLNYYVNEQLGGAFSGPSAVDDNNALTRPVAGTSVIYYD